MFSEKELNALSFAIKAHHGQFRKYSDYPYVVHPVEVREILKTVECTEEMRIAALLHDVIEDTPHTYKDVESEFGTEVADLVQGLTEASLGHPGNRAERKAIDRAYLAEQSPEVQTIKLADIISNTKDIVAKDENFANVYLAEIKELLIVMDKGNSALYKIALSNVTTE